MPSDAEAQPLRLERPPLAFDLARRLIAAGLPGGFALLERLRASGRLDAVAPFMLPDGSTIALPLDWPGLWRRDLFDFYERDALRLVADAIEAFARPAWLIDCGADVGLYSRLLLARTDRIAHVTAVEPNGFAFALLQHNLSVARVPHEALNAAVADYDGWGRLVGPEEAQTAHAAFVEQSAETTGLRVTTVDGLAGPDAATLVLKIDVEGAERAVVEGARQAIVGAPQAVVQIEAHPAVAARTSVDPRDWIDLVQSLRPFRWWACVEKTGIVLEGRPLDAAFFDSFDPSHIYDLVFASQ